MFALLLWWHLDNRWTVKSFILFSNHKRNFALLKIAKLIGDSRCSIVKIYPDHASITIILNKKPQDLCHQRLSTLILWTKVKKPTKSNHQDMLTFTWIGWDSLPCKTISSFVRPVKRFQPFSLQKSEMLLVIGEFPAMNKHNKNAKNDDYTMSAEMILLSRFFRQCCCLVWIHLFLCCVCNKNGRCYYFCFSFRLFQFGDEKRKTRKTNNNDIGRKSNAWMIFTFSTLLIKDCWSFNNSIYGMTGMFQDSRVATLIVACNNTLS